MFSANLVSFLSCLVLCAVILSVVSLSFITLYHLFLIPGSSMFDPCMTRSHRITHIRWAASDRRICKSRRVARSLGVGFGICPAFPLASYLLGVVRHPTPRIVPRFIFGQSSGACGHVCCARFQIVRLGSVETERPEPHVKLPDSYICT